MFSGLLAVFSVEMSKLFAHFLFVFLLLLGVFVHIMDVDCQSMICKYFLPVSKAFSQEFTVNQ